ncbi:TolC family protein [Aliarcobacter thereius]|uniref:Outer membrane efflux protein n=1 Tax=Aliarcobacter thereius LMG 24486 TaxID=1032240 RepID=A0A1C7WU06_9BACT|nr:TolC family protein [Aliarcobacter thereius]OCL96317.1 Outer membrane efflux protein [Aliarcobacter thereius LMG 24486]QBF15720.1 RND family efflux system, outer membrane channel protein, TolC family [Aliarcobacter thereius LMG 24486]TLS92497.1 TolC family protein [Aliarcobacter thereius]
MKKIFTSLVLFLGISYSETISFEELLKQSINNSKELQKREIDIDISKKSQDEIIGIETGKLYISSEISRTNHAGHVFNSKLSSREATFRDFGFIEMQNQNDIDVAPKDLNYPNSRTNINTKIVYDLPLFTGFALSNYKDITKLQEKANEYLYNLDEKNLEYEVLKAYNSSVLAKDFIQTLEKASQTIDFIYEGAKKFHENGLVTKLDVNEAKVYKLSLQAELLKAKNNFKLAISYLRFLSGNNNINDVQSLKNIYFDLQNFDELYEMALLKRDEKALVNISIEANNKNIKANQGSYYPNIFTRLEYGYNDNNFTASNDKDYYLAFLGINLTLFDYSRSSKLEKSRLELLKSKLDMQKLEDGIKLELDEALLNFNSKQDEQKVYFQALNLAYDVLEQAKLQYKNRLISMTTLLSQETNYRKSQTMLLNARYETSLALAKLKKVLGINLIKDKK